MPLIIDEALPDVSNMSVTQSQSPPTRVRIKNRRRRYLELHPEYLDSSLELADPLLYDRLIRRFQTPAEREIELRQKGYAGTLEADLLRSEAKLDQAQNMDDPDVTFSRTEEGEIIAQEVGDEGLTKEEAFERWKEVMEERFLSGKDDDFDYKALDENEEYDNRVQEERDAQDGWFDEEQPDATPREGENASGLQGETGIQDF